ncbi:alginate export family protein [Sphingosinicella soli]|uniref:Alginate export domain-containing protein n=1 Tax=Sphingosinicella soli TaxID=333708 RepID=A0A7W7B3I5_9SPHN|nr:alginate export family protein [Sphingosinicella soli]MBB4633286.1 hypothetical protein [Sphingosinicella soli]
MRTLAPLLLAGCALAFDAKAETRFQPILDARLRYETVDQDGLRDADAVTARLRTGFEIARGDFAVLAESEATLALVGNYNSTTNGRTGFPVVADPENIELNRAQLQYRGLPKTIVTLGRQRIALDDQRFVGNVGWRQNEQTFDAVRIESGALGPVTLDLAYAWSDRTIFGVDSALQSIGGDNVFAGAGVQFGTLKMKAFAYLVDQDEAGRRQFSSQTYGVRASGTLPLHDFTLGMTGSYARQSDWQSSPLDYSADYWLGEVSLKRKALTLTGGYEVLGASGAGAFQTPLATGHKFQGWADLFLVTPANGIRDLYASAAYAGPVSLLLVWHRFESDRQGLRYGTEWNAQVGFKPSKPLGLTLKYADYDADQFGADRRKLWLQLDYVL